MAILKKNQLENDLLEAELLSTCDDLAVGCVMYDSKQNILATAANTCEVDSCTKEYRITHAEINALEMVEDPLEIHTVVVTLSPCLGCIEKLKLYNIRRIFYKFPHKTLPAVKEQFPYQISHLDTYPYGDQLPAVYGGYYIEKTEKYENSPATRAFGHCVQCGRPIKTQFTPRTFWKFGCHSCSQIVANKKRWNIKKYRSEYIAHMNMKVRVGATCKTGANAEKYKDTKYRKELFQAMEPSWLGPNGFDNFMDDIGPKPHPSYYLDRIDNSRGYYKDNVRWVPVIVSNQNKDSVYKIIVGDELVHGFGALERIFDIPRGTIMGRVIRGWSINDACETDEFVFMCERQLFRLRYL